MAYLQSTRGTQAGHGNGLTAMINRLTAGYRRYRLYQTTLTELRDLSDRELADLGLHKSHLRSIAYRAAYED